MKLLYRLYIKFFAHKAFYKFNKLIYLLSLKGLGVLNYDDSGKITGENHFLQRLLTNFDRPVIFDVGANVGAYSSKIKQLSPNAKIYAFEPHPITFPQLKECSIKYNFIAMNAGCHSESGESKLYDYANKDSNEHASYFSGVIENIHNEKAIEYPVRNITIDDYMKENSIDKINLLKIDTEGNEFNVLLGSLNAIKNNKIDIIHFEFNQMNLVSRTFFKDFYDLLKNYKFYRLLPDDMIALGQYNPIFHEVFGYQNIIAINISVNFNAK